MGNCNQKDCGKDCTNEPWNTQCGSETCVINCDETDACSGNAVINPNVRKLVIICDAGTACKGLLILALNLTPNLCMISWMF